LDTDADAGSRETSAVKKFIQVPGVEEPLGRKRDSTRFLYTVEAGSENDLKKIVDRSITQWNPWRSILIPDGRESYGTTLELFTRMKLVIAEQTGLSDQVSALLTFWAFSTWFSESLSLAPRLVITGWAPEGELILRTLRAFCYHPLLMAGLTTANLNQVPWDLRPTLLVSEPNLDKRMALLLDCSTCRGYQSIREGRPHDYFGPKAIYLGADLPATPMINSVHINASDTVKGESHRASHLSEEMIQHFQDQLLKYRVNNIQEVFQSDFNASGLSSEAHAIANALGACIVDAPSLQAEVVSALMPQSQQQIAERLDDLGTLVVGAAFALCHQGKDAILVGEIAAEVNRILLSRGERLQFSAEKVGHKLKKIGLLSRRLGGAGNGFLLDHSTQLRLHEVGAAYGCEGFVEEEKSLHCPLCQQTK
jgi:HPt (histidine-containing phosphotransfer) domain-containing protein